jgi:hypothetical protein
VCPAAEKPARFLVAASRMSVRLNYARVCGQFENRIESRSLTRMELRASPMALCSVFVFSNRLHRDAVDVR